MADATEEVTDLFGDAVPEPSEGELVKAAARSVTQDVFDRRRPKPTTKFVAVQKIVRTFLEAGHDPAELTAAMLEDGALTIAAIEHRIARARERAGTATHTGPHLSKSTTSLIGWAERHREQRSALGGGR